MYLYAPVGEDVADAQAPAPSALDTFATNAMSAIEHTSEMKAATWLVGVGGGKQPFNPLEPQAEQSVRMSESDYKNSDWYVPGKYFNGMTNIQAESIHEAHVESVKAAEGAEAHPIAAFAGGSVGSATDGLYYIPFLDALDGVGVLGKSVVNLGKFAEGTAKIGVQFGGIAAAQQGYKQAKADVEGHPTQGGSALAILEGFAGGLLGGAVGEFAQRFHVPYQARVQAVQKALDQIEAGEPVDVSDVIHIKPVEPLPETKTLYNSGTGAEGVWTSDPERAFDYAPEGRPIKTVEVPVDDAEMLRAVPGTAAHTAATQAGNTPVPSKDYWLGDRRDLIEKAHPITREEITADKALSEPKIPAAPSFAPVGPPMLSEEEELADPFKPGAPISTDQVAPAAPKGTKFSPTNQRVFEHESESASHDGELGNAYLEALKCRSAT